MVYHHTEGVNIIAVWRTSSRLSVDFLVSTDTLLDADDGFRLQIVNKFCKALPCFLLFISLHNNRFLVVSLTKIVLHFCIYVTKLTIWLFLLENSAPQ